MFSSPPWRRTLSQRHLGRGPRVASYARISRRTLVFGGTSPSMTGASKLATRLQSMSNSQCFNNTFGLENISFSRIDAHQRRDGSPRELGNACQTDPWQRNTCGSAWPTSGRQTSQLCFWLGQLAAHAASCATSGTTMWSWARRMSSVGMSHGQMPTCITIQLGNWLAKR